MDKPQLPSPQEMMRSTGELQARFEALCESVAFTAKMIRASYEALVRQGFTEAQALEIVKARGWTL